MKNYLFIFCVKFNIYTITLLNQKVVSVFLYICIFILFNGSQQRLTNKE